jgi:CRISPR-associated protein cas5, dvulg subtype
LSFGIKIIVEGDYACFTDPASKVERVSYKVPTPGAVEGILKCVYWKPAIRYVVDELVVFNPITYVNVRRNELKEKVSYQAVKQQMNGRGDPIMYASEQRTQRSAMVLRNVKYGISAHFELTGLKSDHADEGEEKHYNILLRRLRNGQCFRQPVLGNREFSVRKIELVDNFDYSQVSDELMGDEDLGIMLYKMNFRDGGKPLNGNWDKPVFSDAADAVYYHPHIVNGVIDVKKYREEGLKC